MVKLDEIMRKLREILYISKMDNGDQTEYFTEQLEKLLEADPNEPSDASCASHTLFKKIAQLWFERGKNYSRHEFEYVQNLHKYDQIDMALKEKENDYVPKSELELIENNRISLLEAELASYNERIAQTLRTRKIDYMKQIEGHPLYSQINITLDNFIIYFKEKELEAGGKDEP